jgi:hypothetical protein
MKLYAALVKVTRSKKDDVPEIDGTYYFEVPAKNEGQATASALNAALDCYPGSAAGIEGLSRLKFDVPVKRHLIGQLREAAKKGIHVVTEAATNKYTKTSKNKPPQHDYEDAEYTNVVPFTGGKAPKPKAHKTKGTTRSYKRIDIFTDEVLKKIAEANSLTEVS